MSTPYNCRETNQNPCNQTTPCIEPNCACPILIKTDCVNNVTIDMPYTGILKEKTLNEWILALDTFLNVKFSSIQSYFTLKNVGQGIGKLYKGTSILGEKEIKSVKAGNLVTVNNLTDEVEVAVDNTALTTFVTNLISTSTSSSNGVNVGTGLGLIFRDKVTNIFNFRKIKTENLGTLGESILKVETTDLINDNVIISAKKINSNTLNIVSSIDGNTLNINVPDTFQGVGYYVNGNYTGVEELGTMSKPFKTVQKCIDKILNRGSQNDGSAVKNKWDNLPSTKVYIQSYQTFNENLAINNIIWYLDGFDKNASLVTINNLEYCFDMQELVTNVPKLVNGQLPYYLRCRLEGSGNLQNNSINRKGYAQAIGYSDGIILQQAESLLYLGAKGSDIIMTMPLKTSLDYLTLTDKLNSPISRENVIMKGLLDTTVLQYGALTIKGRNLPFGESLFLAGKLSISCYEQHMMFFDNGVAYSDNVEIFHQRSYQNVNFSNIRLFNINTGYSSLDLVNGSNLKDKNENNIIDPTFLNDINTVKKYYPSTKISDIYLKNNSKIIISGNFYTQINTFANEGGSESFVTIVKNSEANLQGLKITNLLFNHFIKLVNSPNQQPINNPSNSLNYSICQINDGDFNSQCYEELISCEEQDSNDNVVINNTRIYNNISFKNSTLFNINYSIYRKLSNLILNNRLFIIGNPIKISNTFLYPKIPTYNTNALALVDLPIGTQYKTSTGELRIVI